MPRDFEVDVRDMLVMQKTFEISNQKVTLGDRLITYIQRHPTDGFEKYMKVGTKQRNITSCFYLLQVEDSDVLLHQRDGCLTKSLPTDAYCGELLSYVTSGDAQSSKKDKKKQRVMK